jgi:hypothetical protein
MFMTRELFCKVEGFDERFFMYGEDLDLCWKVHDAGKKVWYYPEMSIIHCKGKSSAKSQLRSRIAFYEAMVIFSKKHRGTLGSFFPGWLVLVGIVVQAIMNIGGNYLKSSSALLIDLFLVNMVLWAGITVRFLHAGIQSPYYSISKYHLVLHFAMALSFLSMFLYNGMYSKKTYSIVKALYSGFLASLLFYAFVYFIPYMAFSRIAFGISAVAATIVLVGWRETLPFMIKGIKKITFVPDKVIVIGDGPVASVLVRNIEQSSDSFIAGVVWSGKGKRPGSFEGYPIVGYLEEVVAIIEKFEPDMVVIATDKPWYSQIIEALAVSKVKHLSVKWVPHELFSSAHSELPSTIPLKNFSV